MLLAGFVPVDLTFVFVCCAIFNVNMKSGLDMSGLNGRICCSGQPSACPCPRERLYHIFLYTPTLLRPAGSPCDSMFESHRLGAAVVAWCSKATQISENTSHLLPHPKNPLESLFKPGRGMSNKVMSRSIHELQHKFVQRKKAPEPLGSVRLAQVLIRFATFHWQLQNGVRVQKVLCFWVQSFTNRATLGKSHSALPKSQYSHPGERKQKVPC